MTKIGIIGGSGLDNPAILKQPEKHLVNTKYGETTSPLLCGEIEGVEVAMIARHGPQHTYAPTGVN